MFTCFDCRLEVQGPEARRRGENHEIHAAFQNFLVRIEPHKFAFLININLPGAAALHRLKTAIEFIAKHLAHRVEFTVAVSRERLINGTGAAPATADEADLQLPAVRLAKGN